jgi:hypothetical protein
VSTPVSTRVRRCIDASLRAFGRYLIIPSRWPGADAKS